MPALPASIKSPHKHAFVEIFLLLNGSMEHNVDFNQLKIQKNNLFFISQGQYHFWSKTNRLNLCGYRLMFEERFVQNVLLQQNFLFELVYLNNIYNYPLMKISVKDNQKLIQYFHLLHEEFSKDDFNEKALQANLFLLLLEIQRNSTTNISTIENTHHLKIFQNFSSLVDKHFTNKENIEWYALKLNISTVQLNRIVKKFSQISTGTFIQNRRLLEAKRLLATSSLSIQEIAYKIGIEDASYFTRIFKKQERITPQEFRSKM